MNKLRRLLLRSGLLGFLPVQVHAACGPTAADYLGPFYRRQAPFRAILHNPDEPGNALLVTGRVTRGAKCSPAPGTIVDVWQANAAGQYYDVGQNSGNLPEQFRLRGRMLTDAQGEYSFTTILPGVYGSRPRHIHFAIQSENDEPLITQLYFEGDSRLDRGRSIHQSLVRPVEKNSQDGLAVRFDISLRS